MTYNLTRRHAMALPLPALVAPSAFAATSAPDLKPDLHFGPDFKFGVSSSAYQIEGAVATDGRGPGIWDVFCHTPGKMAHGGNADIACDHYHRMPEDIALIASAGIKNYRFSVSWPRLFPDGDLVANPKGFAFYDRMLDQLHAHGITPFLCLYHWDLPQALQNKGGWVNRDTSKRLADFASAVSHRYRDRVHNWVILNEATVHSMFGYGMGSHAPGVQGKDSWFAALHHLNLGQGLSIQALRANNVAGQIGTVACVEPVVASTDSDADVKAANLFDAVWNGSILQPLFKGSYPDLVAADFAPLCQTHDLANINQKIDMLGVNYYSRLHVQASPSSPIGVNFGPIHNQSRFTVMGWPIEPDGLYDILMHIHNTYGQPKLFISENGYATADSTSPLASLNDDSRIEYITDHLTFLKKAVADGANVHGYFVWSMLDSFEWNDAMKWHFGLVQVDFATLKRTPKKSYHWYADLIRQNNRKTLQASNL
ncbi:MAG: beta-glucosidase [Acidocella sp. 20-57-95]|nr:MAG: beta-glucosidase [Acidocella sp. 20-57-95]OYV58789.1 MAG: beta-glucosidase [Acidocella sp. 21-58-7]